VNSDVPFVSLQFTLLLIVPHFWVIAGISWICIPGASHPVFTPLFDIHVHGLSSLSILNFRVVRMQRFWILTNCREQVFMPLDIMK
jgi:hypothetical protein